MYKKLLKYFVYAFLCISTHTSYANSDWPDLPKFEIMRGMKVQWVAENIKYNGLPMSIQNFYIDKPAQEVIRYYQRYWKGRVDADMKLTKNGRFPVLGVEYRKHYYSIELRPINKEETTGTLTVSVSPAYADSVNKFAEQFPTPAQVTLLNRIESNDNGKIAENLLLTSEMSKDYISNWYRNRLPENGWSYISDVDERTKSRLFFQNKGQHVAIGIRQLDTKIGKTFIEINWVKGHE